MNRNGANEGPPKPAGGLTRSDSGVIGLPKSPFDLGDSITSRTLGTPPVPSNSEYEDILSKGSSTDSSWRTGRAPDDGKVENIIKTQGPEVAANLNQQLKELKASVPPDSGLTPLEEHDRTEADTERARQALKANKTDHPVTHPSNRHYEPSDK